MMLGIAPLRFGRVHLLREEKTLQFLKKANVTYNINTNEGAMRYLNELTAFIGEITNETFPDNKWSFSHPWRFLGLPDFQSIVVTNTDTPDHQEYTRFEAQKRQEKGPDYPIPRIADEYLFNAIMSKDGRRIHFVA